MTALEQQVAKLSAKLTEAGLKITGEKPLQYGFQLQVSDGNATLPVNIYSGKKGISMVLGGTEGSPLRQAVEAAIYGGAAASGTRAETAETDVPPGFEQVAGFDHRWIGTDESGKGDFFGPLVVAAVGVNADSAERLSVLGVKDSKTLTDKKARALATQIRTVCAGGFVELEISPVRYNSLYQQFRIEGKNLNHLLAWAHARALEDMLQKVPCRFAIADKFADERFINSRLMAKGREITLVQTPRAERNVAVAAASVLARDRFLWRMEEMAQRYGMQFPKGASALVIEAGRQFVGTTGRDKLAEVAKLHFKTLDQI